MFGFIWPRSFRGEDFFNISQSETRIALGGHICWRNGTKWRNFSGPYIDAFCQVWFHLVQLFQSRLKYEKLTDGRQTTDAKWWQYLTWHFGSGELKMRRKISWTDGQTENSIPPSPFGEQGYKNKMVRECVWKMNESVYYYMYYILLFLYFVYQNVKPM